MTPRETNLLICAIVNAGIALYLFFRAQHAKHITRQVSAERDELADREITWSRCPNCAAIVACTGIGPGWPAGTTRAGHCDGCGRNIVESDIAEVDPHVEHQRTVGMMKAQMQTIFDLGRDIGEARKAANAAIDAANEANQIARELFAIQAILTRMRRRHPKTRAEICDAARAIADRMDLGEIDLTDLPPLAEQAENPNENPILATPGPRDFHVVDTPVRSSSSRGSKNHDRPS
tara:strand:- start:53 stop:754 length:702 start_codon:yes stop_codon:yes gene_type:complete